MASLRWRRVATTTSVLAAIAAACVWAPVFAHRRELRERSRVEHLAAAKRLDAVGMWPCDERWDAWPFAKGQPVDGADLVMTVNPSFHGPWRVALFGNRVHVEHLQGYPWGMSPPPPVEPVQEKIRNGERLPDGPIERVSPPPTRFLEADATIDPDRAARIRRLFGTYVPNPPREHVWGHDGAAYQVEMGGHCAQSWSGSAENGATRLTEIASLLALRASRGAAIDNGRSERAIDILLESFEHGDGHALLDYQSGHPGGNPMVLGPDWSLQQLNNGATRD